MEAEQEEEEREAGEGKAVMGWCLGRLVYFVDFGAVLDSRRHVCSPDVCRVRFSFASLTYSLIYVFIHSCVCLFVDLLYCFSTYLISLL